MAYTHTQSDIYSSAGSTLPGRLAWRVQVEKQALEDARAKAMEANTREDVEKIIRNQQNLRDEDHDRVREAYTHLEAKIQTITDSSIREAAERLKEKVEAGYIENITQLRKEARSELIALGIFESEKEARTMERRSLSATGGMIQHVWRHIHRTQGRISGMVSGLLAANENTKTLQEEVEKAQRASSTAVDTLQELLGKAENRTKLKGFLQVLATKGIPKDGTAKTINAGVRDELAAYIQKIDRIGEHADIDIASIFQPRADMPWTNDDLADALAAEPEINKFAANIRVVADLVTTFDQAELRKPHALIEDLGGYIDQANNLKENLRNSTSTGSVYNTAGLDETIALAEDLRTKLESDDTSVQTRKLAQAFLDKNSNRVDRDLQHVEEEIQHSLGKRLGVYVETAEEGKEYMEKANIKDTHPTEYATWIKNIQRARNWIPQYEEGFMSTAEQKEAEDFLRMEMPRARAVVQKAQELASQVEEKKEEESEESEEKTKKEKRMSAKIIETINTVTSVNGHVQWWTIKEVMDEVKDFFELIKKDYEDHVGDKTGGLKARALKLMSERLGVQNDKNVADYFRSEAEKRKKNYEFDSKDELLHQVAHDKLATATRLGMLLALADRGQLRVTDRAVVEAVCQAARNNGRTDIHPPPDELWEKLENSATSDDALWEIRSKHFVKALKSLAHGFYPFEDEALAANKNGYLKSKEAGEKTAGSNESMSAGVEFNRLSLIIEDSAMEGDGIIMGMLTKLIARGNLYSGGKVGDYEVKIGNRKEKKRGVLDMGVVALTVIDHYLRGNINRESLANFDIDMEGTFPSMSVFRDVLLNKKPGADGHQSDFEKWGWVADGTITKLGATEIIKFFNTNNAEAKDGSIIHIATDSANYKMHSAKISTDGLRNPKKTGSGAGDKIASYNVKNTDLSTFEQVFENSNLQGSVETRTMANYVKAGIELFEAGRDMMARGERYYDVATEKEISKEQYDEMVRYKPDSAKRIGLERMEKGARILEVILTHTRDTTLLNSDTGMYKTTDGAKTNLAGYITSVVTQGVAAHRGSEDYAVLEKNAKRIYKARDILVDRRNNRDAYMRKPRTANTNTPQQGQQTAPQQAVAA